MEAPKSAQEKLHPKPFSNALNHQLVMHAVFPDGKRQLPWLVAFVTQVRPRFSGALVPIEPAVSLRGCVGESWMDAQELRWRAGCRRVRPSGRYFPGIHCIVGQLHDLRRIRGWRWHNMASLPCSGSDIYPPIAGDRHMLGCIGVQAHCGY